MSRKKVAVIGLGKIGLPLALQIASSGASVLGCDSNSDVVSVVNSGDAPFSGEPGMERLRDAVNEHRLQATQDLAWAVSESDIIVIVVPLLVDLNGQPTFENIDDVTRRVGQNLRKGALVIFETTLPVGTTRNRFAKILERESDSKLGHDFFLAYSPERVYSGKVFENLSKYPKLVGGTDLESGRLAEDFYGSVISFDERSDLPQPNGVWNLGSSEAAELAKLAETTYRDVNIALANEFAINAESLGVDIYKVIEACNSQPFSSIHQPGIAVGGHCIPVYPHFYLMGHPLAKVVNSARQTNLGMPALAIKTVLAAVGNLEGLRVAVLGLAYRGGVKEHSFSGALTLVDLLLKEGAIPLVNDPMYSDEELRDLGLEVFHLGEPASAVILQTHHQEYESLGPDDFPGASYVYDGRNSMSQLVKGGIATHVLGRGV